MSRCPAKNFDIHQTFYSEMFDENPKCPAKNWTFAKQNVKRGSNKFRVLWIKHLKTDIFYVAICVVSASSKFETVFLLSFAAYLQAIQTVEVKMRESPC